METSSTEDFADNKITDEFKKIIIPKVWDDMQNKNYQEALNTLDEFYKSHANQDNKHILVSTCTPWKALIFEKQERYPEALLLYEKIHNSKEKSDIFYINSQTNMARVLSKMGDCEKAIEVIQEILRQEIEDSTDLLNVLELYVDVLEKSNQLFPKEYKVFVENVAEQIGISLSNADLNNSNNLTQEIKELSCKHREANRRYSILVIGLNQIEDNAQKKSVLEGYISEETVGLYRNMAVEELNNL